MCETEDLVLGGFKLKLGRHEPLSKSSALQPSYNELSVGVDSTKRSLMNQT